MRDYAKICKQNILRVPCFYRKEWKKGTRSKRDLTAFFRVATVWKIRGKTCFFKIFLENQGKSGNVRENFCSL